MMVSCFDSLVELAATSASVTVVRVPIAANARLYKSVTVVISHYFPVRVQLVPLFHKLSFSAPPPPVTLVPKVVHVVSPQLAARPSMIKPVAPAPEDGSDANLG